jgi:hypothetical protein
MKFNMKHLMLLGVAMATLMMEGVKALDPVRENLSCQYLVVPRCLHFKKIAVDCHVLHNQDHHHHHPCSIIIHAVTKTRLEADASMRRVPRLALPSSMPLMA